MPIDIANMVVNVGKTTNIVSWTEIGTLMTSVAALVVSVTTLLIYKKFWTYDILLKEEFRVLLEFKNAYTVAQNSIHWFLNNLLIKEHRYGFHVEQLPIIKRQDIIEHYNKINKLNNFYNDYQYVFRKYKIEKDIELLTCFLDIVGVLPAEDINLVLANQIYQKEGDVEIYLLPQIGRIGGIFITMAYQILNPVKFPQKFTDYFIFNNEKKGKIYQQRFEENLKKLSECNSDEGYEKIRNEVASKLNLLSFKLDNLCMFPMKKLPKTLNLRQKKIIQS